MLSAASPDWPTASGALPLACVCPAALEHLDAHHTFNLLTLTLAYHIDHFANMATQTLSSAGRIRELTEVNSDVASMLSAAGQAINALTNRPLNAPNDDDNDTAMDDTQEPATLEARKQAFQQNSTDFYNNLQAVVAKLRRQAYALEEAGIITPEATSLSTISVQAAKPPPQNQPGRPPQQTDQQPERITNGGMGNQDIGTLNSKGNRVGADKEKELVEDTKKLLDDVIAGSRDG